jgi:hypothetical protein
MSEIVDVEIRDEVMSNILAKPGNQICFDCGSKGPKWSSPYLGIVICVECASKHRSYGTHISFVRSVDLDNWKRRELKSLELTGNSYTKERFNDLGVPLIGGVYDYNNSMVLKVRQEIAEKVRESLMPDDYIKKDKNKKEKIDFSDVIKKEDNNNVINTNKIEKEKEKVEIKDDTEEKEKEEIKPQAIKIKKNTKVKNEKIIKKGGKKNKITKVDFDLDFDSFNDVNFGSMEKENEDKKEEEEDSNKKEEKEKEKEKEKESEEGGNTYDFKISKKEINKKFANKKAISSEDYAALENDDSNSKTTKERIKFMGNAQAISSEDVFGSEGGQNVYEGESMTNKLKEMALNFTLSAAEKAKELKNKTGDLINKVQSKFSGSGY